MRTAQSSSSPCPSFVKFASKHTRFFCRSRKLDQFLTGSFWKFFPLLPTKLSTVSVHAITRCEFVRGFLKQKKVLHRRIVPCLMTATTKGKIHKKMNKNLNFYLTPFIFGWPKFVLINSPMQRKFGRSTLKNAFFPTGAFVASALKYESFFWFCMQCITVMKTGSFEPEKS